MAVAEVIVICIDNTKNMSLPARFEAQWEAIQFYCKSVLDANPENEVALITMSDERFSLFLYPPTKEFQDISSLYNRLDTYSGEGKLSFKLGVMRAVSALGACPPSKQKRAVFFVGGLTDMNSVFAKLYGSKYKLSDIAVDVINFYGEENKKPKHFFKVHKYGREELEEFVEAANCNGNSHIVHIKYGSCVCEAISNIFKKTPLLSGPRTQKRDRDYGCGDCFKCGKPGHFARECASEGDRGGCWYGGIDDRYGGGGGGRGRFDGGDCFKYGKPGHFARECASEGDRGGGRYGGIDDRYGGSGQFDGGGGVGRFGGGGGGRGSGGGARFGPNRKGDRNRGGGGYDGRDDCYVGGGGDRYRVRYGESSSLYLENHSLENEKGKMVTDLCFNRRF